VSRQRSWVHYGADSRERGSGPGVASSGEDDRVRVGSSRADRAIPRLVANDDPPGQSFGGRPKAELAMSGHCQERSKEFSVSAPATIRVFFKETADTITIHRVADRREAYR